MGITGEISPQGDLNKKDRSRDTLDAITGIRRRQDDMEILRELGKLKVSVFL